MSVTVTQLATSAALVSGPPGQPDISYAPNWDKWQARIAQQLRDNSRPKTLPEGLPKELTGRIVWDGESLEKKGYQWTYVFNEGELEEIEKGLEHFKSLNLPHGHISQQTFPLPTLHATLRTLSHELHHGHGFFVLRGVNVDAHTRADNIAIYAGISSHIAPIRGRQDNTYDGKPADVALTHIYDVQTNGDEKVQAKIGSPAYTADKQVFHTDSGDIISLFSLGTAAEGGESLLASTWRVYNEIARTRPDIVHTLINDWPFEVFTDPPRIQLRPLLFYQPATDTTPERIALQYARRGLVGFGALPRHPSMQPITEAQAEALDTLHFLGEKFCVKTNFRKGDMQYVNNLGVFHAREGFRDDEENHRHLVRLWLRDPENAWETPDRLKERWAGVYEGVKEENQVLPLEPFFRSHSSNEKGVGL